MNTTAKRLISLFLRHPDYFNGVISCSYPLSLKQVRKYSTHLYWTCFDNGFYAGGISSNERIRWSVGLLNEFKLQLDWQFVSISILGKKVWYEGIIDDFSELISWSSLSSNYSIDWNEAFIDKYSDKLDWHYLSGNTSVKWTKNMLERFEKYIDFDILSNNSSVPWANDKVLKFTKLTNCLTLDESLDLIEKYENRLNWEHLFFDWNQGLKKAESDEIIETFYLKAFAVV